MVAYTQFKQREVQHAIVFGEHKTGKSTLVSQLAEDGFNLIWFSVDNGHSIIGKLSEAAQARVDVINIPDTRDFPAAIDTILKAFTGAKVSICHMHGQVNCSFCKQEKLNFTDYEFGKLDLNTVVVIDHLSQIADSAWNLVTQNYDILKEIKDQKKDSYDLYMKLGMLMNKVLTHIQQARWHTCAIAQVIETELDSGDKRLVPRVGSGPFSRCVGSYFDHMILCEIVNLKHRFGSSTGYKNTVVTGSRSDIAIEKMPSPSLAPFFRNVTVSQQQNKEALKTELAELKTKTTTPSASEILAKLRSK